MLGVLPEALPQLPPGVGVGVTVGLRLRLGCSLRLRSGLWLGLGPPQDPLVKQVIVIDEDDDLEEEEVGDTAHHRAHRPAALLDRLTCLRPALAHEEVGEHRHRHVQRERGVGDVDHVVDELLWHDARRGIGMLIGIVPPNERRNGGVEAMDCDEEHEPAKEPTREVGD